MDAYFHLCCPFHREMESYLFTSLHLSLAMWFALANDTLARVIQTEARKEFVNWDLLSFAAFGTQWPVKSLG